MVRKIFRVISWSLLVLTVISILLVLRKPSAPTVATSMEAAKSFDQKLGQLDEAHQHGAQQEVRITEVELNSKLQESVQGAVGGPVTLSAATIHLEGEKLLGTFTVNVSGKDIYLTIGGTLGVTGRTLEFKPTDVKMGSLPVPVTVIESALRERLDSPEMRERMKLPDNIKNVRIENGELVLQTQ